MTSPTGSFRVIPGKRPVADAKPPGRAATLEHGVRYRLERSVSEREHCSTYDATQLALSRRVVVRVFQAPNEKIASQLHGDVAPLALLKHPVHARVLDAGLTQTSKGPAAFLVTEHMRGEPLRSVIGVGPLPLSRATRIADQLLAAMDEVHVLGLWHGALSVDSVLLLRGVPAALGQDPVRIVDLSERLAARRLERSASLFARSENHNERADVLAIASVFHACLTGHAPVNGARASRPTPTAAIPPPVARLLARAFSAEPSERFESARQMREALREIEASSGPAGAAAESEPGERKSGIVDEQRRAVWVLSEDPAVDRLVVRNALGATPAGLRVVYIDSDERAGYAQKLNDSLLVPPALVLFGDLHVILEDPLLIALRGEPETARVLVSTHVNPDLMRQAINTIGVDHHVSLPVTDAELGAALDAALTKSRLVRHSRLRTDVTVASYGQPSIRRSIGA